jgi:hypothetical protein
MAALVDSQIITQLLPCFLAFGGISGAIILSSLLLSKRWRIVFQSFFFSVVFAITLNYFLNNINNDLLTLWNIFKEQTDVTKFILTCFFISISFFGGSFYAIPEESGTFSSVNFTPATSDVNSFEVPDNLPIDDNELFDKTFNVLRDDIISSVSITYEMPAQAAIWIERMINYTVDGGKKNRGLALMDVQNTFAKSKGALLSNKVL